MKFHVDGIKELYQGIHLQKRNKRRLKLMIDSIDEMAICKRNNDFSFDVITSQSCESLHYNIIKRHLNEADSPLYLY